MLEHSRVPIKKKVEFNSLKQCIYKLCFTTTSFLFLFFLIQFVNDLSHTLVVDMPPSDNPPNSPLYFNTHPWELVASSQLPQWVQLDQFQHVAQSKILILWCCLLTFTCIKLQVDHDPLPMMNDDVIGSCQGNCIVKFHIFWG